MILHDRLGYDGRINGCFCFQKFFSNFEMEVLDTVLSFLLHHHS